MFPFAVVSASSVLVKIILKILMTWPQYGQNQAAPNTAWLVVIGKERRILNICEACQFLTSVLELFAKTVNEKAKESLWTLSTIALA